MAKFVFITGGVVSSIGKGIVAASLGRLLKSRGYDVSILKLDPYLNVDPGTMSPFQHGRCSSPKTAQKQISISAITSASLTRRCHG